MKELNKNKINFLNIFIVFSILVSFGLIVKDMFYDYAIKTNIDKANVVTQQLLSTRHYVAKVAPHIIVEDPSINPFALSPAFIGSQVGQELETKGLIYIKQTSLKYRNPQNAPDIFETKMLKEYLKTKSKEASYEIAKIKDSDYLRYSYPLYITKECLACHGKPYIDVKEDIYNKLIKYYGDKSFNYKVGDLRGMISVAINMNTINQTLETFFQKMLVVMIGLFLIILIFFYLEKKLIYEPQILKIKQLNQTLESRIKEEVAKNREQDQRLIQQSRLAQMGEMISMIAHQWRQPLNAISATTSALELKLVLGKVENDAFQTQLKKINEYSQHLSKTIDDFRNFFKNNKTKTKTNLEKMVLSTKNIVETSMLSNNIELDIKLDCQYMFEIYENEVKQVILNIIKNAEDAILENNVEKGIVKIYNSCGINQNNPTLYIKDNAGGISKDILDKIFDPYFSTKTKKDGTGLGLYMSKIIIEEHCEGKLSVYNEDDGAVFKIEFNPKGDLDG